MAPKKEISLLPDEHNANTLSARVVRWAVTAGRFVIVFTELIVIGAFISRFWLDRRNSDLSETYRQQKAILQSTSQFEKAYNLLSQRLTAIDSFYKNQPDYTPGLNALVESTPNEIVYKTLAVTKDPKGTSQKISLTVYAYQESSIVDFITNLVLNPVFSTVSVDAIEKKPKDAKYTVTLALNINPINVTK